MRQFVTVALPVVIVVLVTMGVVGWVGSLIDKSAGD
jgi:hypothetical protein